MQINTYASDYLYVTRFYRSFLAGTTLKMSFSSCCCRGEVSNGYPKRQTGRLYKWKFKIVAQLYSKVPSILIQKALLKGRTDVFKLHPSFGKIVIIMVCLYLKELYRGCYVSASALSHTFASVVWTKGKQWIVELIWARTYVWSTFLNNNSPTFFKGAYLFWALSSIFFFLENNDRLVFKCEKKITVLIHFEPFNSLLIKKETQTLSNLLFISLDLRSIVFLRQWL